MSHHYYREEPNVRFSPDKTLVIFTSNMFGPSYVFGAEVAKADNPPREDVQSTPDLARKFNPVEPPNSKGPRFLSSRRIADADRTSFFWRSTDC
jgi:oligogalacturonide lyase